VSACTILRRDDAADHSGDAPGRHDAIRIPADTLAESVPHEDFWPE
jgi:hypothetical protein